MEFFTELPRRRLPCRYDNPIPRPVRPGRFVRSLRLQQSVHVPVSYSCARAPPALFREGLRLATPGSGCGNINLRSLRRNRCRSDRSATRGSYEEAIKITANHLQKCPVAVKFGVPKMQLSVRAVRLY